MGRHTKGRRKQAAQGPSVWFFVALAIGVALLIWMAVKVVQTPVKGRGFHVIPSVSEESGWVWGTRPAPSARPDPSLRSG